MRQEPATGHPGGNRPSPHTGGQISPAALFRAVEAYRPTLLIERLTRFWRTTKSCAGILNSGHRRSSAYVCAALARIGSTPVFDLGTESAGENWGTSRDSGRPGHHCQNEAEVPAENVERYAERRERDRLTELRRRCLRWAKDNAAAVQQADPADLPFLHDRANDNWRPLLAIADTVGGPWPERARESARLLSGIRDDDTQPARIQALIDIRDLFERSRPTGCRVPRSSRRWRRWKSDPGQEWKARKADHATATGVLLRPFGVKPKQFKEDGDKTRGYLLADFADAFSRYIPPNGSVPPVPSASSAGFQAKHNRYRGITVPDRKSLKTRVQWARYRWYRIKRGIAGLFGEIEGEI